MYAVGSSLYKRTITFSQGHCFMFQLQAVVGAIVVE